MDWANERWVKLYTRSTADWVSWAWESRCVMMAMLREVDRAGQIGLGRYGAKGLAALLHLPIEVVEPGLAGLLDDGCVTQVGQLVTIENFVEAQEARTSDKQRQRDLRDRRKVLKEQEVAVTPRHTPSRSEENRIEESRIDHKRLLSAGADPGSSFGLSNEEPKPEDPNPVVQRVFEHWRTTLGHPAAKLDRKRRQAITAALALGYTEEQLTIAIAGCASSPWHLGKNDRKTRYDALTLILRDAEQIDKFIGLRMTPDQQRQVFGGG